MDRKGTLSVFLGDALHKRGVMLVLGSFYERLFDDMKT